MKDGITKTTLESRTKGKTDFQRLREMRDQDIDYSDIPKLDKSFWKAAKLAMPQPKDRLTIRLDHDLVEWLKQRGSGYQTRINAILRSYMRANPGSGVRAGLGKPGLRRQHVRSTARIEARLS